VSPGVLQRLEQKSVKEAEANMSGAFHCKTPDCAGWTVIGTYRFKGTVQHDFYFVFFGLLLKILIFLYPNYLYFRFLCKNLKLLGIPLQDTRISS
jgi:hypothetical protein